MVEVEKFSGVPRFDSQTARTGEVTVELDDPVIGTTVFEMKEEAAKDFQDVFVAS